MTAAHLAFVDALAAQHMARARDLGRRHACPCGDRPDARRRVVESREALCMFGGWPS